MTVTVIVGAQWGDEGKGKVTDYFAESAHVVARYQGGNNAGHTVIAHGQTYKFHLLPSGVVHSDKINVIGNGVVIDPAVLRSELDQLHARGLRPRVLVSDRAHVILPWHRLLDGAREAGKGAIGTTKRGIGPVYSDKAARLGVRVGDLLDPQLLRERLEAAFPEKEALLRHYGVEAPSVDAVYEEYLQHGKALSPHVADTVAFLAEAVEEGEDVLLEGAQGTFLDIDHGTYPFCTSSNTTSGGACAGAGIPPTRIDEVVGIVKAYTTRVGAGPFPTELPYEDPVGRHLTDVGREFGTTTGRRRRCGWLDLVLLRRAARVNGFTAIALTKLDVLSGLDKLQVATAYEAKGRTFTEMPADPQVLAEAKPVLREFDGFTLTEDDIMASRREGLDGLPRGAREYVAFLEESLGVPIVLVGLGPARHETLDLRDRTG